MDTAFLACGADDEALDARALSKLRWRCRRGLLENDLFIGKFFERHGASLTLGQARGLSALMDLADNDLLDLLLWRKEPQDEFVNTAGAVREVLGMLRNRRIQPGSDSPVDEPINHSRKIEP